MKRSRQIAELRAGGHTVVPAGGTKPVVSPGSNGCGTITGLVAATFLLAVRPRMENADYLMASGIAGSIDEAFRSATTNLMRWLERMYIVVHRFATWTLGLAPARCGWKQLLFPSRQPAVCVPPGARQRLHDILEDLQRRLGVGAVEEVTFVEQSLEAYTYRDGVRFANGCEILLQQLTCGQRAEVLSLGCGEEEPQPPKRMQAIRPDFVG